MHCGPEAHEYLMTQNTRVNHSNVTNTSSNQTAESRHSENREPMKTSTLGVIKCRGNNSVSPNHLEKSRSSRGVSERFKSLRTAIINRFIENMEKKQTINFGAGPAKLPQSVSASPDYW